MLQPSRPAAPKSMRQCPRRPRPPAEHTRFNLSLTSHGTNFNIKFNSSFDLNWIEWWQKCRPRWLNRTIFMRSPWPKPWNNNRRSTNNNSKHLTTTPNLNTKIWSALSLSYNNEHFKHSNINHSSNTLSNLTNRTCTISTPSTNS